MRNKLYHRWLDPEDPESQQPVIRYGLQTHHDKIMDMMWGIIAVILLCSAMIFFRPEIRSMAGLAVGETAKAIRALPGAKRLEDLAR